MITNVNATFFVLSLLLQEHTSQDILVLFVDEDASLRVLRFGAYMDANARTTGYLFQERQESLELR